MQTERQIERKNTEKKAYKLTNTHTHKLFINRKGKKKSKGTNTLFTKSQTKLKQEYKSKL